MLFLSPPPPPFPRRGALYSQGDFCPVGITIEKSLPTREAELKSTVRGWGSGEWGGGGGVRSGRVPRERNGNDFNEFCKHGTSLIYTAAAAEGWVTDADP